MQQLQDVLKEIQSKNPELAKYSNAASASQGLGIKCETVPSEKCPLHKCDGSGMLWMIDYDKKINISRYAQAVDNQQRLLNNAKQEGMSAEYIKELDDELWTMKAALRKPTEWWEPCACYEQREKQKEANKRLDMSGIPECFRKAKVHGFKIDCYKRVESRDIAELAKLAATNYIEHFEQAEDAGKGLYFTSRIKGSGKTRLASSIANALINLYNKNVIFIKAADISAQVRKTYNKDSDATEIQVLQTFYEADVLVIDDLAVENNSTPFVEELLSKILDHRMDKRKITIVTSNRPIEEIDSLYKKGIVQSRIKKMCIEIIMPEESIRDQEADTENQSLEQLLFSVKREGA